ncbi:hypothetical protein [Halarcobacter sp.]|uniref:hypothetical protein n=1 Tax=Halarcobacter sp. TaxID=2321133 RepID=UPI002AAAEB04|nr:hypothetical protein [Halarcobacter sp.]
MIDPKRILRFLEEYFDEIKTIYKINKQNGVILKEECETIFNSSNVLIDNLIEYEIIEQRVDDTFTLNETYGGFISFLLDDFSLDMPEQIEKYYKSLDSLYRKLKVSNNKNETIKTIEALNNEINKFENQLRKNITKLIKETKYIKANNQKLDYPKKLQKASQLTTTYIEPLNIILQNHSESILYIIDNIIDESSKQRFSNNDENLKKIYTKLYNTYYQTKKEILNQNRLLINEVIPLLDRIKSGSDILTGFINFLNNNTAYNVPVLLDKQRDKTYSTNAEYEAQNVWEGYIGINEDVIISKTPPLENIWIYDKQKYKNKMLKSLPIENFYIWIYEELRDELDIIQSKNFLDLSKLIFDKDIEIEYTNQRIDIDLADKIINVPTIKIRSLN